MNQERQRLLVRIGVAVVVGIVFFWSVDAWILSPRGSLAHRIETARGRIESRQTDLLGVNRQDAATDLIVQRTLGGSQESVDHALRAALSQIAEASGLSDASVSTSAAAKVESPGRRDFKGTAGRALRDELDFVEVPATLRGSGTWEQVTAALHATYNADWLARVEGVRLSGKGDQDLIELTVAIRTLFIPGREADGPPPEIEIAWPPQLAMASPFLQPPKPDPEAEQAAGTASNPKWERWSVTFLGRVEGVDEVWLAAPSGTRIRLQRGQSVDGSTYLGNQRDADGFDEAIFRRGKMNWIVPLGASMADRHAVSE